jgi:hypothetical protein
MKCFLCGETAKKVKNGAAMDPCGKGDAKLYRCIPCDAEWFVDPPPKKGKKA